MKPVAVGLALCAVMMASSVSVGASSESCKMCSRIVTQVASEAHNFTTENVTEFIQRSCLVSPRESRKMCRSVISKNVDHYASLFFTLNASQLCAGLSACPDTLTTCSMCQFIIARADEVLPASDFKKELDGALDGICDLLPAKYDSKCKAIVDKYVEPNIGKIIGTLYKPISICKKFKFCSPA